MQDNIDKLLQERQAIYGDAVENFVVIGEMWSRLLDLEKPIEPHLVALMMIQLKIWRAKRKPDHIDSWEDIIGYSLLGQEAL